MTGDGGAMQAPTDDKQLEKGLKDKTQSSGPGLWPFIIVSSSYLLYTITDGAIRMVVLLHAYEKGFSAMEVAIMFTLYEVAGVVTNLLAGIAGSRWGLRTTLLVGLSLQLVGISSLFGWEDEWGKLEAIIFVTFSQMLCGIAKDLTKLGGKTVAKLVTPDEKQSSLFRLVSFITGMKNSLKGAGYFLGAATVSVSYSMALGVLLGLIVLSIPGPIFGLSDQLGRTGKKVTLRDAFQMNYNINVLSASRMFLFGSRDAWFEVPLPFFLRNAEVGLNWSRPLTGTFLAVFIILYGQIQSWCPQIVLEPLGQAPANKFVAMLWAGILLLVPLGLGPTILTSDPFQEHDTGAMSAIMIAPTSKPKLQEYDNGAVRAVLITFIVAFCAIFAVNSAVHSYLVLRYAEGNKVAVNVGFYYMSNAAGRLIGTILSGVLYSYAGSDRAEGFGWCFVLSAGFVLLCTLITAGIKDDDAGLMCGPLMCVGKLPDSSTKLEASLEASNPGNALVESAGASKEKAKLQANTDGVAVEHNISKEAAPVSEGLEGAAKLPGPPGLLSAPEVEQSMSRGEAQGGTQGAEKSAAVDVHDNVLYAL